MKFSLLRILFHLFITTTMFEGEGGNAFMGGSGGGGAAGGEGGAGGEGDPAPGDGPTYQYPEGLDKSYHGNPTLLKFANEDGSFNHANIMKSMIHAQSQMGADKMIVPNQNFTDEQWAETFHKLGVPKEIADYTIENKIPEGMTSNDEMFNSFKELAHQHGLLPKQAQAILDFYNTQAEAGYNAQNTSYQEKVDAETADLKQEWGEGFEKNISMANQAFSHLIPDEAERKAIIDSGFLDSAAVTKLFHRLGQGLQEDGFDHQIKGTFGKTPGELDGEITRIHGELSAMGKAHPQYQAKLNEYQQALNKRHGTKPVAPSR